MEADMITRLWKLTCCLSADDIWREYAIHRSDDAFVDSR